MSKRRLLIIIFVAILTILYPAFIWAETPSNAKESPYSGLINLKEVQSPAGVDFSFSVGPGFLYFQNLKGNLSPTPTGSFSNFAGVDFQNIRKLSYNKTPLFEVMISKRIISWLKCGLSFYAQSGVSIESDGGSAVTSAGNTAWAQFRSNLQLYALMAKAFAQSPYPLLIRTCVINTYFGLGVGPSWQSWTNNQVYELLLTGNTLSSTTLSLNNKFNANATWTADAGFSFQPATAEPTLMVRVGCKYTDWGKVRSIGAMKNQEVKLAPFKPITAKKIYSFCPYIGVNWCF